jgi:hypothetical protein
VEFETRQPGLGRTRLPITEAQTQKFGLVRTSLRIIDQHSLYNYKIGCEEQRQGAHEPVI